MTLQIIGWSICGLVLLGLYVLTGLTVAEGSWALNSLVWGLSILLTAVVVIGAGLATGEIS